MPKVKGQRKCKSFQKTKNMEIISQMKAVGNYISFNFICELTIHVVAMDGMLIFMFHRHKVTVQERE